MEFNFLIVIYYLITVESNENIFSYFQYTDNLLLVITHLMNKAV